MKKIIFVLFMITAAAALFATGQQELNDEGAVELNRGTFAANSVLSDLEKVKLTGTVLFESPVAELKVGTKQYTLMAPGGMAYSNYISEGDKITVNGYIVNEDFCSALGNGRGVMRQNLKAVEGNTVVFVETVELNGTVYELPWVNNETGYGFGSCGFQNQRFNNRSGFNGPQGGRLGGGMRRAF